MEHLAIRIRVCILHVSCCTCCVKLKRSTSNQFLDAMEMQFYSLSVHLFHKFSIAFFKSQFTFNMKKLCTNLFF